MVDSTPCTRTRKFIIKIVRFEFGTIKYYEAPYYKDFSPLSTSLHNNFYYEVRCGTVLRKFERITLVFLKKNPSFRD
jgi:hypothetical protein